MTLGPGEFIVIGFVLVVVFSAARMGALGNAVGRFVYSFKKASSGHDLVDVTPPRRAPQPESEAEVLPAEKKPDA